MKADTPTAPATGGWQGAKLVPLAITVAVAVILWFIPPPEGVKPDAWHIFAIFAATILGVIIKPLPMGAVTTLGLAALVLTETLPVGKALDGFSNTTIWLIVIAFFISRGFIKTGLGKRIAYLFVAALGKRTLGLSYGLIATDLVLAPAIPSNTARAGGVVFPTLRSIAHAFESEPDDETAEKCGRFLTLASFEGNVITSGMFLTAMAANPLAAKFAAQQGVNITWTGWAVAAVVPGLVSLIVLPLVIYWIWPPKLKRTENATAFAREKLKEMGPVTAHEWIMLGVFVLLLVLWIFGSQLTLDATAAAFVGLGVLLLSGVLTWEDILKERGAWDTLVWFAVLVMMATEMNAQGLIPWFSQKAGAILSGVSWGKAFIALVLIYLYSHYLFASQTAHVTAMYAAFLAVAIAAGTPPMLAALVLGFFSNIFSSLTHYGTGPAPILFGSGYVPMGQWWKAGLLVSVINVVIWLGLGSLWWKVLGHW
jgi:DASS family divalent anion:Na+ symporter